MIAESLAVLAQLMIVYAQEIEENKRMTEQNKKEAKLALSKAFIETEGYYAVRSGGKPKDLAKEHAIAALWDTVSICMEPFNTSLAHRLGQKSRFWREGGAWSDEQIKAAKIQLDAVRRDGRFALL
jgi:hypothetical protein